MLKPCPFCGKDVYMEKRPLWKTYNGSTHGYYNEYEFIIECTNPECRCNVRLGANDTIYRTEEEAKENAIRQWNRRAVPEIQIDPITDPIRPTYPNPWTVRDVCVYAGPTLPEDYWGRSTTAKTSDSVTISSFNSSTTGGSENPTPV